MAEQTGSREPFSRAYFELRSELARAGRPPGSQIRVDETARSLAISPTPVREALSRLAGERLVLGCRRRGYFVPRYSGSDLAQLYQLSEMHLQAAIASLTRNPATRAAPLLGAEAAAQHVPDAGPLFVAVLSKVGLPLLFDAGALVIERLAIARRAEHAVVDTAAECERLLELSARATLTELGKAIRAYHRVRRMKAEQIAALLVTRPTGAEYIPDMV